MARGTTAALGAGVKLLDESAEVRIGLSSILGVGSVHKLVAVVVHFHSAGRAIILSVLATAVIIASEDQSRDICARPWRGVFAIQMSSFKNLSIRRM